MDIRETLDWINWTYGLVFTLTGTTVWGWVRAYRSQHEASKQLVRLLKDASLATLHSQLYDKGGKYIKRGDITISELDDLEYTWTAYKGLGGNGTGEKIYNKCRELPIADYQFNSDWQAVENVAKQHEANRNG
ncbi:hypothetical protein [Leuconostoc fallax]|uniref:hypothetical protein n=1 Tax=Leuconostoc fallax TaxID=1251 RepID=UPI001C1EA4A6|nr:hypothetical protein [Leuconostoc fallax]MBU7455833.1 hypothetical protein [Leuconostoc fallax]